MDTALRDILVKSLLGGLMIALILTLARFRQYTLAGLLVSLPAVSLYTFWWIGKEHGPEKMQLAVRAALCGALPWALYLWVAHTLASRTSTSLALLAGMVTYLATNSLVYYLLQRFA